jgi:hypothetical protein
VLDSIGLKTVQFFTLQATAFLDGDQAAVARQKALAPMDVTPWSRFHARSIDGVACSPAI